MRAILVVGEEEERYGGKDRFLGMMLELRDFLRGEGCPSVLLLGRDYTTQFSLLEDLKKCMLGTLDGVEEPWLLAYHGHGMKGGWAVKPNQEADVSYVVLVRLLEKRRGPTLFLNDCCHSSSFIASLERRKVSSYHVGVLQASYEEYPIFAWPQGSLIDRVLISWRAGASFKAPIFFRTEQEEYTRVVLRKLDLRPPRLMGFTCSVCQDRRQRHLFPLRSLPHFRKVDPRSRNVDGYSETYIRHIPRPTVFKRWGVVLDPCFFAPEQGYFKKILQPMA